MGPATHESSSTRHPKTPRIHPGGRAEEKCFRREEEGSEGSGEGGGGGGWVVGGEGGVVERE